MTSYSLAAVALALAQALSTPVDLRGSLVKAALDRPSHTVRYTGQYVRIAYPGGDVPPDTGACTDEIVRIYRAVGIDLQKEVHEDMMRRFDRYPHAWGLKQPDTNIDHRRVPNLARFFELNGVALQVSRSAADYQPGDIVTWDLGGGVPHIGMVVDRKAPWGGYMIVHNVGSGPKLEDVLLAWKITGHYRYFGSRR